MDLLLQLVVFFPRSGVTWIAKGLRAGKKRPLPYNLSLFKLAAIRNFFRRRIKTGSTADERARSHTSVWGEVEDDQGRKAVSRLHGPEAGVIWTSLAALATVQKVLAGYASPGFQTPSLAYGADFVLEGEGVRREDLK